MNVTQTIADMH